MSMTKDKFKKHHSMKMQLSEFSLTKTYKQQIQSENIILEHLNSIKMCGEYTEKNHIIINIKWIIN